MKLTGELKNKEDKTISMELTSEELNTVTGGRIFEHKPHSGQQDSTDEKLLSPDVSHYKRP